MQSKFVNLLWLSDDPCSGVVRILKPFMPPLGWQQKEKGRSRGERPLVLGEL